MRKSYMDASSPLLRGYFGNEETIKRHSALTVNEYFLDLRGFFRYYKHSHGLCEPGTEMNDIDILDVDEAMCRDVTFSDILGFLNYSTSELGNGEAAQARKCSSLRSFFAYLVRMNIITDDPTQKLNSPKRSSSLPHFLSLDQSIDLLSAIDGDNRERDYCIITLFLNCGMRLSELVGINFSDLLSDDRLRIRGKGGKERIVYLNEACVSAIEAYKEVRPTDGVKDKDALFLSRLKRRISPKTVQALVKKYLGQIGLGVNGYSVHKLRHTAATLMYQTGEVDILAIKEILGHSDLGTTQIYTHIADERKKSAAAANPLAHIKDAGAPKKEQPSEDGGEKPE